MKIVLTIILVLLGSFATNVFAGEFDEEMRSLEREAIGKLVANFSDNLAIQRLAEGHEETRSPDSKLISFDAITIYVEATLSPKVKEDNLAEIEAISQFYELVKKHEELRSKRQDNH